MKKTIVAIILAATLTFGVFALKAEAQLLDDVCSGQSSEICDRDDDIGGYVVTLINILLWIVGILAVIMIVFGGIKYVLSTGDSNKTTAAKNTILYSVIGLIVALLAYAIVNYVIDRI